MDEFVARITFSSLLSVTAQMQAFFRESEMYGDDSNLFWSVLHQAPSLQSVTVEQSGTTESQESACWAIFGPHLTTYVNLNKHNIQWIRLPIVGLHSQISDVTVEALCRMQDLYLLVAPLARMGGVEQTPGKHLRARRLTGFAGYCRRPGVVGSLERTRRPWVTSLGIVP
jgi:hypothetical protein